MTNTTRWSPDTCGCVVTFDWDDAVPAEERVHSNAQVEVACVDHAKPGMKRADHDAHHAMLVDENQRKNRIAALSLDVLTALVDVAPADDGGTVKRFKPGHDASFTFDRQRVLVVRVAGMNAGERATLQARADAAVGVGKTRVL